MDILVCTTANTFTVYNRVVILKNVSMIFYASDVLLSLWFLGAVYDNPSFLLFVLLLTAGDDDNEIIVFLPYTFIWPPSHYLLELVIV